MARYEEKFANEVDMQGFILNMFNSKTESIKKIDARSYQGGYKVIIKTVERIEDDGNQEV